MDRYDLIVRGGLLVDPKNHVHGCFDLGLGGGKVQAVAPSLANAYAPQVIDAKGKLVIPGIIDSHVHIPGHGTAHREMALAGVTTAVDYGRFRRTMDELPQTGAGLCIAGLEILGPFTGEAPSLSCLESETDRIVAEGALGIKIMGGHSPSTPEATALMIQAANNRTAYVGYHIGTTKSASNLVGLREMFDLAGRNRLHVAHVNAYLRGMTLDLLSENKEAFQRLADAYWMVSESHLGPYNGTGGAIGEDGLPHDWVTRNCLKMRGYGLSREGMSKAFRDGYVYANTSIAGKYMQYTGEEGLRLWEEAGTKIGVSFPVNSRATAHLCATAKVVRQDGSRQFVVDAISTDGGSWRNFLVEKGLALVKFSALSLDEFVEKVSSVPAMMYGMISKGHLSVGADADVSVIDFDRERAYATIVGGKVAMLNGTVLGTGATIVCTERGKKSLTERGFSVQTVNIEDSLFWTKGDQDPGKGTVDVF